MADKPTLVLIDGHSLAYRAFHALPQELSAPDGEPTNAVLGFASMLLEVLRTRQPEYVAVTFDLGRTFRHDVYPEYKATREAMPELLVRQMPRIRELVSAFGIPMFEAEGWEADDLLGTLASQAAAEGLSTLIVTGDTDAFQLVDDNTVVVTSGRRFSDTIEYDTARVLGRYGVQPATLPQWKGLRGDSSDNIPGVPGIGDKTATKLLAAYSDVDGVIAHTTELPGKKLKENITRHADIARLGAQLATIRRDAPVRLDLEAASFQQYDRRRVIDLFRRLAFRSLMDRLPPDGAAHPGADDLLAGEYVAVTSIDELADLVNRLRSAPILAFDTETTSRHEMLADLVGIAITDQPGRGWYVPVGHRAPSAKDMATPAQAALGLEATTGDAAPRGGEGKAPGQAPEAAEGGPGPPAASVPLEAAVATLAKLLGGPAMKVAHNAKYDLVVLKRHGATVAGPIFDTMVAAWVAEPGRRAFGLKDLAWAKLGVGMRPISDLIGKGQQQVTMATVPIAAATEYACRDVDATIRLRDNLLPALEKCDGQQVFETVEMPLVRVLADMEMAGILVDPDRLTTISTDLSRRLGELQDEIYDLAGHRFNIASPQQLSQVLFDQMGVPRRRRTQTGYSTSAAALAGLEKDFPIVATVLEWRHLTKLKGTYVDSLPELIHPETGRIHTSFQQTAVVTGRISSSDPNLQNIPVRTEEGGQIRSAFTAPPGSLLMGADYSQMELRVLAHLSGDEALSRVFAAGGGVHAATASFLFCYPAGARDAHTGRQCT